MLIRRVKTRCHVEFAITGGLLCSLTLTGCANPSVSSTPSSPPAVVVTKVVRRSVPIYGEYVAQIQAEESVEIAARVEGNLAATNFEEGRQVKKGQVLYWIDPAEYEAKVASARAALAKAESTLTQAKELVAVRQAAAELEQQRALLAKSEQDVARYRPLVSKHAIPEEELDTAIASAQVNRANVDAADANLQNQVTNTKAQIEVGTSEVQSAKAELTQAELNLSYCTIRAPFDGLIGRTRVHPGALVSHGGATVLNEVVAIDPVQVTFGIPETSYLAVKHRNGSARGVPDAVRTLEAELVLADDSVYPLKGRFKLADSAIDQKTGTLAIVLTFANPDGVLRPNGFGRVRLVVDRAENAALIPPKAAIEQQGGTAVLVVGTDNKVSQRTVVLGAQVDNLVIVTQGLEAGERVIVEGQQKARPGATVIAKDASLTEERK